jgi:peptidoglycan/xylan/chitin deacetylase (PgdA/CDA1 family)
VISKRATDRSSRSACVPVLMYHSVSDSLADARFQRFVVDPHLFGSHLDFLIDSGYRTVTVGELVRLRQTRSCGKEPADEKLVALTFDDAYADFADEVMPRLVRSGLKATLYAPSGFIGGKARWLSTENEQARRLLDWRALLEISQSGLVQIGSHSHTHPELDRLPFQAAAEELRASKFLLEDRLGIAITTFSYPFGYFTRATKRAVTSAGFETACGVSELPFRDEDDLLSIPRLSVESGCGRSELSRLISSPGSAYRRARARVAQAVWRGYRQSPIWRRGPRVAEAYEPHRGGD